MPIDSAEARLRNGPERPEKGAGATNPKRSTGRGSCWKTAITIPSHYATAPAASWRAFDCS
jgi:hypothetical protein